MFAMEGEMLAIELLQTFKSIREDKPANTTERKIRLQLSYCNC